MRRTDHDAKTLLEDIRQASKSYPIAALADQFNDRLGWKTLIAQNKINQWADDTGTRYVEEGRQQ